LVLIVGKNEQLATNHNYLSLPPFDGTI